MARQLVFLAVLVALCLAEIPVIRNPATFGIRCQNFVTTADLGLQNGYTTVTNILKVTGLSLIDFILLQDRTWGDILPTTDFGSGKKFCIAGYYN